MGGRDGKFGSVGDGNTDGRAMARKCLDVELGAELVGAFAHSHQSKMSRARRTSGIKAASVVHDLQHGIFRGLSQIHTNCRAARMLQRIGNRLLAEPEQVVLDSRMKGVSISRALELEFDRSVR